MGANGIRHLGTISFSLYVFLPVANALTAKLGTATGARATLPFAFTTSLLITTALAIFSYNVLERPFLPLKHCFTAVDGRSRAGAA